MFNAYNNENNNNLPSISIICHLYYFESWETIKNALISFKKSNPSIFINLCQDNPNRIKLSYEILLNFPNAFLIITPNQGKDIGGKLALINLYLQVDVKCDYIILLHDKLSPQTSLGETWKKKLFRIIDYENANKIIDLFRSDSKIGVISSQEFILNEYNRKTGNFNCTNNLILKQLIEEYSFKLKTHNYVGGTIFWIKAEIFNRFFKRYSPIEIRATLEKGNVLDTFKGTNTHSWERMLSWIAIDQGYDIKGI